MSASDWRARLEGDLAAMDDLPSTFAPGQALYVIADAPAELDIPDPALRIRYYHQDHLGSSSVMTDAQGVLVEETAFYPFGEVRSAHRLRQVEEAYQFSQKERDRESGLQCFEARYLTGQLSRFLSADPTHLNLAQEDLGDPQPMNLYAYVRNNPLQYIDPTGLDDLWIPGVDSLDELDVDRTLEVVDDTIQSTRELVGRGLQIVGGGLEVAAGKGLCATVVGCVLGAPLIALGVDNVQAGIRGSSTLIPGEVHTVAALVGGVVSINRALAQRSARLGAGRSPGPPVPPSPAGGTLPSSAGSLGGRASGGSSVPIEANTNVRIGRLDTVPSSQANTLMQAPGGPRLATAREIQMMDPAQARIIQRLEANREALNRMEPREAGDLLRRIFNGED